MRNCCSACVAFWQAARPIAHEYQYESPHEYWSLLQLFRDDIPAIVIASTGAGWWLISTYPDLITLVASATMIDGVEHGRLWTGGMLNIAPASSSASVPSTSPQSTA
jgi:hypothetical protein